MCGICGVVNFDGRPVAPEVLRRMMATLAHRGPDGEGTFFHSGNGSGSGPAVGIGHRRLAVIDLSPNAKQPMSNNDATLWIVFNGEIYNFRELRARLQAQGRAFRSHSDTEVILHLYEELGDRCVDELDGMFAFALWDGRRRRLFLARDRVGKKPLYYARAGPTFVFASEVKAILRHPAVSAELLLEAIPQYFTFGYPPPGRTFYQAIAQLPPAHTMTVEANGRVELQRYWDLTFPRLPQRHPSLPEAAAQVRALLTDAVRKRLVADVPLGAFLSGGVDSSIVVGLMSRLVNKRVRTFSLGFAGEPGFDETRYARLVAGHFGTDHTEFIVEPKAFDLIESLVWHHDGPFGDPSAIPTYLVARLSRQHVTVALNGDGGDELFAGYLRFQAAMAAEYMPRSLSKVCARALALLDEPLRYHHWLRRARRFFAASGEPLIGRMQRWVSIFDEDLPRLLRPEIFADMLAAGIGYPAEILDRMASFSTLAKILYLNFKTYLPDDLLVKMDRSTMAHGLEGRSPFLDPRLAEYVAGLPDQYKLRWGTTKHILRTGFADLLPTEILQRAKRGFGVPLGAWFRGELRESLQDLLLSPRALSGEYLHLPYVEVLVREHTEGTRDHGQRLWALLAFEVWLRAIRNPATELMAAGEAPFPKP